MENRKLWMILPLGLILTSIPNLNAQSTVRTVIDTQLGGFFTTIPGLPWTDWGFYVQVSSNESGKRFSPQALKVDYTRFQAFSPSDDSQWPFFPYSELKSFEASEVSKGRAPIFMTAHFRGKKRPLLFSWDLHLVNGRPTSSPSTWHYAVNVGDERFMNFWLNNYLRRIMMPKVNELENLWFGLDETTLLSSTFGVLDDDGNFVSDVPWDEPFAQSPEAYLNAVKAFFEFIHAHAPEVRLIPNLGFVSDPSRFFDVLGAVPGLMCENCWDGPDPIRFTRNERITTFANFAKWGAEGKVSAFRMWVKDTTQLATAFSLYSILKGPNSFFIPMFFRTTLGVPPSEYGSWLARLGNPAAHYTSQHEPGKPSGYDLYSRAFDGGTVYLNWTGTTKTIELPKGAQHFDREGNPVSRITIQDGAGTFVSKSKSRALCPAINPRFGGTVKGPITVTITSDHPNATIRFTTDGSTPTEHSFLYTGPFPLWSDAMIKAVAFVSGQEVSAEAKAFYSIEQ